MFDYIQPYKEYPFIWNYVWPNLPLRGLALEVEILIWFPSTSYRQFFSTTDQVKAYTLNQWTFNTTVDNYVKRMEQEEQGDFTLISQDVGMIDLFTPVITQKQNGIYQGMAKANDLQVDFYGRSALELKANLYMEVQSLYRRIQGYED